MSLALRMKLLFSLTVLILAASFSTLAQTETATLSGVIQDPKGAVVPEVEVTVTRIETQTVVMGRTNGAGIYFFTGLMPGHYHLLVHKPGFKQIAVKDFELNVQSKVEQNFSLEIGSVSESVTVNASDVQINTTDASVSTVVDRQFAENLPLNGRSFQSLIQLAPGVVVASAAFGSEGGQFSVNGQRSSSNYWMVDGVGANIGTSPYLAPGVGLSGAVGSFSASGGTNSLVSVDALQEFRIQTSTYAPEFGRTPGAQISIVTRSGTNQWHGTAFDYFRNDILDANDWFANSARLPKPPERQNDFGGTISGPILKDKTFFFFSYEGLRLRLPQTALTTVPDLTARQNAVPAMQPFLNAFPLPNGPDDLGTGIAQFNASFSNPSTLDAYSLRMDHKFGNNLTVFGRYNYSPSSITSRGNGQTLNTIIPVNVDTQTGTLGATWIVSPTSTNDLRFNYSRVNGTYNYRQDNFGGATPLVSLPFPSGFTQKTSYFGILILDLSSYGNEYSIGNQGHNLQRQFNIVDGFTVQRGPHSLKFGVDYRRLSPVFSATQYFQLGLFGDVLSAEAGSAELALVASAASATLVFNNIGAYAQDTWKITPRLTMTYGLRWDVDVAPTSASGTSLPAVTGYDLNDPSNLALARPGTAPFATGYGNFAPRVGVAYQLFPHQDWQTVFRSGFGVFYDLADTQVGNLLSTNTYPFTAVNVLFGVSYPLSAQDSEPPPISPAALATGSPLIAFDPHLKLPYVLQWNVALEQALGRQQTLTASYVGSSGRRLLQAADLVQVNANIGSANLIGNTATSNYNAFQLQFQRRLSWGLQALASYTWSHSIDTGSTGSPSYYYAGGTFAPDDPNANRGPSDFDIRNAFSLAVTYDVPVPKFNTLTNAILRGWSVENIVQARSASPVNIADSIFSQLGNSSILIRPDVVPGQPLYLYGSQYPGDKAFNESAFTDPPVDPVTHLPTRQGSLGRNALRGFGATQWDFAVHRDFPIRESLKLQFRAEMFNVLNHPNFGPPSNQFGAGGFGVATQMLGQSLGSGNVGTGAFSPLYQIGGPRSIQLALKLTF